MAEGLVIEEEDVEVLEKVPVEGVVVVVAVDLASGAEEVVVVVAAVALLVA